MKIINCKKCNEEAILICMELNNKKHYFIRVRRIGKCKDYQPPSQWPINQFNYKICRTKTYRSAKKAIDVWNKQQLRENKNLSK